MSDQPIPVPADQPDGNPDPAFGSDPLETAAEQRIAELMAELAECEKRSLRHQADLDNFRRRMRRETEETIRYAAGPLMLDVLDALDNLERAIQSGDQTAGSAGASSALADGVRMVAGQIADALARHGCQRIESVGQPFDPQQHQAVQSVSAPGVPPSQIVHELRAGFRLHDRVLRTAQVVVSAPDAGAGPNGP